MTAIGHLLRLHARAELDEAAFAPLPFVDPGGEALRCMETFREICREHTPGEMEGEKRVPDEALRAMAEGGLFGMTIPREYGGLGFSFREYLAVVADMAKVDIASAMVSLAHLSIGVQGVVLFGTEEQRRRILPAAARGEMLFAYALTEPGVGSDAQHIETVARLSEDGEQYVLQGKKAYITNANYAHAYTVFARIDGQPEGHMGAFVVPRDSEGLTVGEDVPKMGLAVSSTAFLDLDGVRVPAGNRLGEEGQGFRIAMSILSYGRLAVCAGGVGLLQQSVEDMVRRASRRKQFGGPIRRFELIQEKIAATRVDALVASSMVDDAARQLEREPTGNVAVETSHCKLFATSRAWRALYEAMQVAGGSGYLATSPYEKRMRDYRVATIFEGTTEIHSIYPAGLLTRALVKDLPEGMGERLWFLLRGAVRWVSWPSSRGGSLQERRARRTARWCVQLTRLNAHLALIIHGRKLEQRQYVLRHITWLSVYAYGLLVTLARVRALREGAQAVEDELDMLEIFTAEARQAMRRRCLPWRSRRQRLLGRVASRPEP